MSRSFFLFLVLFCPVLNVSGKDYAAIHYTTKDGLPSNTIYTAYRDSEGFLWMASDKGVVRYNGLKFELFTIADGLPDNEVFFFQEDKRKRLWIATFNGALCYYSKGGFISSKTSAGLKLPCRSQTKYIDAEADSSVSVLLINPLSFVTVRGDKVSVCNIDRSSLANRVVRRVIRRNISEYEAWVGDQVLRFDSSGNFISARENAADGLQYCFSQNQQYYYNEEYLFSSELRPLLEMASVIREGVAVNTVYHDGRDFFIATSGGIFYGDGQCLFPGRNISSVTQDIEGNYWICVLGDGIYCLPAGFRQTEQYNGVYAGRVVYAHAFKGRVRFVTSEGTLSELYNERAYAIHPEPGGSTILHQQHKPSFWSNKDGGLVGVSDLGFVSVPPPGSRTRSMTAGGIRAGHFSVKNLQVKEGVVYVRSHNTILAGSLPKPPGNVLELRPLTAVSDKRLFDMQIDRKGTIWAAATDRMYTLNAGRLAAQLPYDSLALKWFAFQGCFLVGCSRDNVLYICDTRLTRPVVKTVADQSCIWEAAIPLDEKRMLLVTNRQYRMLTRKESASGVDFTVSIIENPFIPLSAEAICSDAAYCYFLKEGSVTRVPLDYLVLNSGSPRTILTDLVTSRGRYSLPDESDAGVRISYDEGRSITLNFKGLAFNAAALNYEYSVSEGRQEKWNRISTETVELFNMRYGRFTVRVRSRNASGHYGEPATLLLIIEKPVWAEVWFISLACVLGLSVLIMAVRYRYNEQLRKKAKEYDLAVKAIRSEYKALNALMNPHFIFNSLNNLQALINRNDKGEANKFLHHFSSLIRRNMHNAREEYVSLQKELDLVENYLSLEKLRFKDFLNYRVCIGEDVETELIMLPPLLIQPLVENAVIHGLLPRQSPDGLIVITVEEDADNIRIEVRDNGVGMSAGEDKNASARSSLGLELIRKRIAYLNELGKEHFSFSIMPASGSGNPLGGTVATILIKPAASPRRIKAFNADRAVTGWKK